MGPDKETTEETLKDKISQLKKINIGNVAITERKKLLALHPVEAMKQIDIVFEYIKEYTDRFRNEIKRKGDKTPRLYLWAEMREDLSLAHGTWSHVFNNAILENIKKFSVGSLDEDDLVKSLCIKYKYVYAYWWNRYHYIENVTKKYRPSLRKKTARGLDKTGGILAGLITDEIKIEDLPVKWQETIKSLSK